MTSQSAPKSITIGQSGAERRRHRRYEVEWEVELEFDGEIYQVTVSDVSASGALILATDPPPPGEHLKVKLPDYGWIEAQIVHAAADFCGVEFLNPARHRDALARWLESDVSDRTKEPRK